MKSKSYVLCVSAFLCLGMLFGTAARATIFPIASIDITKGGFVAYDYLDQPFLNPSSGGTFTPFSGIASNTNLVGGYLGNTTSGLVDGLWFGQPALMYTASAVNSSFIPGVSIQGGAVPSGTIDNIAGTISMDLSSVFVYWFGVNFHQGTGKIDGVTSSLATGTWDSNGGLYSLSWISNIDPMVCGPLGSSCSAKYTLEGHATASTVPEPAVAYLLGAGLIGLAGFARKRKAS